ncbi:putative Endonuclease/exonuclease/phosphatase domain-containing protein [Candidatus Xenohaliotis californiensis]|uniref:Endonuclease/exonuclease/phosphatase domain-containing protein n=1 Tax=Candidatus Xenohaliotis californiensis TaxID=84677 RepID=A0ABM9N750_9RICK|nr:putative Endonuclease/exonuclease/phosphatase domain-containing protein [Candidatus Xenohaliotis californiensis]
MKAFHMNLLNFSASNINYWNGKNPQGKLALLANELDEYHGHLKTNVDIAGFTEVGIPNNPDSSQLQRMINSLSLLSDALRIPTINIGGVNVRYVLIVKCGQTALGTDNECVAIVLNGNALNVNCFIDSFTVGSFIWNRSAVNINNFFALQLSQPNPNTPDYRYPVGADFSLNGTKYTIGFIHNRAPGNNHVAVTLAQLRTRVRNNFTLIGGDFNTAPLCSHPNTCQEGRARNCNTYYHTGANTTSANNYDWWLGGTNILNANGVAAKCNATPNTPGVHTTGSDHRGIGIDI